MNTSETGVLKNIEVRLKERLKNTSVSPIFHFRKRRTLTRIYRKTYEIINWIKKQGSAPDDLSGNNSSLVSCASVTVGLLNVKFLRDNNIF